MMGPEKQGNKLELTLVELSLENRCSFNLLIETKIAHLPEESTGGNAMLST